MSTPKNSIESQLRTKCNILESQVETLEKKIDASVFEEALSVHYNNETVLNPSLWPEK